MQITRHTLEPGDIGAIVRLHGLQYACEYQFNVNFEAYVAKPLAEFALRKSPRERIWIVENDGELVACSAITAATRDSAQLRWYLVAPTARGCGLGRQLLSMGIAFAREQAYRNVVLWTVSALKAAGHLYAEAGFQLVEQKIGSPWGVEVVEEKYQLDLAKITPASGEQNAQRRHFFAFGLLLGGLAAI